MTLIRVNKQCTCPICKAVCTNKFYCKHFRGITRQAQILIPGRFPSTIRNAEKIRYLSVFEFKAVE